MRYREVAENAYAVEVEEAFNNNPLEQVSVSFSSSYAEAEVKNGEIIVTAWAKSSSNGCGGTNYEAQIVTITIKRAEAWSIY